MALEDLEYDTLDRALWLARERNNPHGLGDYPRRMIILDDNNQEEKECADEQRQVKEL